MFTAVIIWALLLIIFSFIALKAPDPSNLLQILSSIALFTGAFFGGRVASTDSENKLVSGLIAGTSVMVPVLLTSLILSDWSSSSLLSLVLTVVASVLGAAIHKNSSRSPSSGKRRKEMARRYGSYSK